MWILRERKAVCERESWDSDKVKGMRCVTGQDTQTHTQTCDHWYTHIYTHSRSLSRLPDSLLNKPRMKPKANVCVLSLTTAAPLSRSLRCVPRTQTHIQTHTLRGQDSDWRYRNTQNLINRGRGFVFFCQPCHRAHHRVIRSQVTTEEASEVNSRWSHRGSERKRWRGHDHGDTEMNPWLPSGDRAREREIEV